MNGIQNSSSNQFANMRAFRSKSTEKHPENLKIQVNENDPFMKWPLRGLAYSNELGECLRPVIGHWAWAFWAPAVAYIGADVADKYQKGPDGKPDPSQKRATKQLAFQTFASVLLPTAAVKLGNYAANRVSSLGKDQISLTDKDKLLETLGNSLRHETHATEAYKGNRAKFVEHIVSNFKSDRDKTIPKLMKKDNILGKVLRTMKKPFAPLAKDEHLTKYTGQLVDDALNMYDSLMSSTKPKNISKRAFKVFQEESKTKGMQTAASRLVEKTLKNKSFKTNKALLAAGGFISLGLLMKPIDNFVEKTLIEEYIEPTIYNFDKSKPLKSFKDAVAFQRKKREEAKANKTA